MPLWSRYRIITSFPVTQGTPVPQSASGCSSTMFRAEAGTALHGCETWHQHLASMHGQQMQQNDRFATVPVSKMTQHTGCVGRRRPAKPSDVAHHVVCDDGPGATSGPEMETVC